MYEQITTARLPAEVRDRLQVLSGIRNKTKSDIIKEALELYFEREENELDSFTLGESFFGKYGSGDNDRATTYKERIKRKLSSRITPDKRTGKEMSGEKRR